MTDSAELNFLLELDGFRARSGQVMLAQAGEARLCGFIDPWLKIDGKTPAYFGYFRLSASATENASALEKLETWARERGVNDIWGPIDYSTFANYRYRTTHLEHPAFFGEPANGALELETLERAGFTPGQRYVTYEIENLDAVRVWAEKQRLVESLGSLKGFHIVSGLELDLNGRIEELYEVTHHIFSDNFAFKPIHLNLFKIMFARITATMCQQTSVFLLDADKRIRGYFINFADTRDAERVLLKTAGVAPAARLMGLTFLAMLAHVVASPGPYKRASLCLMREGNFPSLISKSLFDSQRDYALFRKSL